MEVVPPEGYEIGDYEKRPTKKRRNANARRKTCVLAIAQGEDGETWSANYVSGVAKKGGSEEVKKESGKEVRGGEKR